ncbi:Tat pathway signal sequence domain protein [Sphingomonas floccifaciens]|uniref:Tat pathway signal sequence domain protein n=1 Tax=Sphingomonas floccifaciens TaxID=1844115 RepID=A0ABW4NM84_9SPHN
MFTRREAIRTTALTGAGAALSGNAVAAARAPGVAPAPVRWIDGAPPPLHTGQTFGVAWPRGAVGKRTALALATGDGTRLPGQNWTIATWPDGSVKWSAHALPADIAPADLTVVPGKPRAPADPVAVRESADTVTVTSGDLRWEFPRTGSIVLRGAWQGERQLVGPVRLMGSVRDAAEGGTLTPFKGSISTITVEQRGPVRAVIRVEGKHRAGTRDWLFFTVRFYAYAGTPSLRIVHSFVYDGDPTKDFLASLGLSAEVPMRGSLHDRHIRIAHDRQTFAEAVRPLTGLRRDPGAAFRDAQVAGKAVPPLAQMAPAVRDRLDLIPAWNDFRLEQANAHGFTLTKRTGPGHAWIDSDEGRRAPGLAYVGSPQGGAALGVRYFWQRHPSAIDIDGAAGDTARLTAWLWSPRAAAMDMRPYHGTMGMETYADQVRGLDITYEDYEPGWDTPTGIARTSELTLWALPATPETPRFEAMAAAVATPPQLMASPEHLHRAGIFGDWNLPDRSGPNRTALENQLADMLDFYEREVDQRSWYGFWDHGDVMHTYDADRHQWRYDIGGFAWANSELSPDLWLWYQVLRAADPRAYRFAEAMTRHTGEVDVYHLGRFAGLGTRHGVQHFADSSKQTRVSNAAYRRIFFYLSGGDERVGDLMRALVTSDRSLTTVEIGRKTPSAQARPPAGMIDMTFGTTWCTIAAAWLTEWERTGDTRWRDRIVAGMDSIGRLPNGWLEGSGWYDLASGRFLGQGKGIRISHLNAVFGAPEISAELIALVDVPRYRAVWLDYCRWYNAPKAEFEAKFKTKWVNRNLRASHARLTAYAAKMDNDPALAARAVGEFYGADAGLMVEPKDPRRTVNGVTEWPGISTNAAAQFGLTAIQMLDLVPAALEEQKFPPPRARRPGEGE